MKIKTIAALIVVAIIAITGITVLIGNIHKNDTQNYQVVQSVGGEIRIQDQAGYYVQFWPKVWTWPRAEQIYFSESSDEGGAKDESIMCTYNDGGQAKQSVMLRYQLPTSINERIKLHQDMSGNPNNVRHVVRSHMINCIKASAPLMSASEHQSARKSEFTQLVNQQLEKGLFKMLKKEKVLKDKFDENGKPITVFATEIVYAKDADGNETIEPEIAQESPLKEYGIKILQFSITGTNYDKQTREQFAAKKAMFLKSETMKSEQQQLVQERLKTIEEFNMKKAQTEGAANVEKAQAIIKAEKEKEMAIIAAAQKVAVEEAAKKEALIKAEKEKEMAVIAAAQKVAVEEEVKKEEAVRLAKELMIETEKKKIAEVNANKMREVAMIDANRKLEVAKLEKAAANETAEAIKTLAAAEEEKIAKAGAITEVERVKLEIAKSEKVESAKAIADAIRGLQLPGTVIMGAGDSKGSNVGGMDQLMQLFMLKQINTSSTPTTK